MIIGQDRLYCAGDKEWIETLQRVPHDIYHTPAYHLVPGFGSEGAAHVFVHQEADKLLLWPYLLTPVDGESEFNDVASVYGYAGPISHSDPAFVQRAWLALCDHWRMQKVVSAFTRFHPILGNQQLIATLPESQTPSPAAGLKFCGATISIDLTKPLEAQVKDYQKILRQEIRKSRELGFVTSEDSDWQHVDDFVRLYRGTMSRRKGRSEYLIDSDWVAKFRGLLGAQTRLFVTKYEGVVAAALLAMQHGPFLHAHLTGIEAELVTYSPLKVLLDQVREWGTSQGFQFFHLGGGLGGREDSLFQFKRRFSPQSHEFHTGSWILNPAQYTNLEEWHKRKYLEQGLDIGNPGYFPIYRYQPDVPDREACSEISVS